MMMKRAAGPGSALLHFTDAHPRRTLFCLLLSAVLIRLFCVLAFPGLFSGDWMDSVRYERVAFNINVGRGFSEYYGIPTAFVGPVYPYFLAGVHRLFGQGALPVQLLQVLFGGLVCLACYSMGVSLAGTRTGLIAAALAALSPELAVMTGFRYTETLFMLFTSWAFALLLRGYSGKGNWKHWMGGGLLFGMGLLTRHVLIFFPPVLALLALLSKKTRPAFKGIVIFSICAYSLLIPWTIRNARVFHALVPVATGGGGEFWIGSYIPFQGRYHYDDTRNQVKELSANARNEVERDRILYRAGLKNMAGHPVASLCMAGRKFLRFFFQVYQDRPSGKPRSFNALVLIVLVLSYYPVLLLALVSVRSAPILLSPLYGVLVYSALLCAAVHVVPRYRIPLMPFFIVLAAVASGRLLSRGSSPSGKRR
jgi:4-amino-4-deoxy-L-arabinose transferase-like glycosyltransferase